MHAGIHPPGPDAGTPLPKDQASPQKQAPPHRTVQCMLGDKGNKHAVHILLENNLVVTGRNEVVAKVMFLLVSVILLTEGGFLPQCMLGYQPPGADTIPQNRHTPRADTPTWSRHPPRSRHPPGADTSPEQTSPPGADTPGSRLRHTVNERSVRILLECILVFFSLFKRANFYSVKFFKIYCESSTLNKTRLSVSFVYN